MPESKMPIECAKTFAEIAGSLKGIEAKVIEIGADVKTLNTVVIGNGTPEKSLAFRVKGLELDAGRQRGNSKVWVNRAWNVVVALALALFAWRLGTK